MDRDDSATVAVPNDDRETQVRQLEPHNLLALSAYSVLLRFAWIFKTESVIIPAFLDSIAGAGWLRGCLPVLNRFGQSLPPIFFARRLQATRVKKWSLLGTSAGLGLSMLAVSAIWILTSDKRQAWLPPMFLLLYLAFFASNGLNQQVFGTLQGKLIRADKRGELLGLSGIGGAVASIIGAWFLLQYWLSLPDRGFGYIFGFSGLGFLVAGVMCLFVKEPPDVRPSAVEPRPLGSGFDPTNELLHDAPSSAATGGLGASYRLVRDDRDFRRLGIVAMLFIAIQLLFPHFQALGQENVAPDQIGYQLMLWVIAQNGAVGVFSWVSGKLADRFGNRLALRLQVFGTSSVPLLALFFTRGVEGWGPQQFWITFFFLGLTPVTIKTLTNYALELTEPARHPLYVATLHACLAVPLLLSPLVGWLVDWRGFEPVFIGISGLIALGGIATLWLVEPRHQAADAESL
ncbi:MAG: MFS transporter [Planctomycetaceae bacterium]